MPRGHIEPSSDALTAIDAQLQAAQASFSRAALACLHGNLDAHAQVRAALAEVDRARASLRQAAAHPLASD